MHFSEENLYIGYAYRIFAAGLATRFNGKLYPMNVKDGAIIG